MFLSAKTLSDPIMEELAQYMVIQSSTIDLETPTGTPLKGSALKTPFKQIAEDMARQGTSGSVDYGHVGHTQMVSIHGKAFRLRGSCIRLSVLYSLKMKSLSLRFRQNSSTDSQSFLSTGFAVQSAVLGGSDPRNAPAAETMKIVVDSSISRIPPRSVPLRTLPAPRKPSPKVGRYLTIQCGLSLQIRKTKCVCFRFQLSPPGSTTSTILDDRTVESETSRSNKSSTTAATSFSMSQIKPIPGTHIRALDFGAASSKQGSSTGKRGTCFLSIVCRFSSALVLRGQENCRE